MVSFSDIVTNLIQLSDDNASGLSDINLIVENFKNSNSNLENLRTSMAENCSNLEKRGLEFTQKLTDSIRRFNDQIGSLEEQNAQLDEQVVADRNSITEEVEKIKSAQESLDNSMLEVLNSEKDIDENINVLRRLKNLAIDELQGMEKKVTQMDNFNVDKTLSSATSFIQTSTFQADLKGLLNKSDSMNRGLISTLILLTQSASKSTYANPETVKKIVSLIENIIENSAAKKLEVNKNGIKRQENYSKIIQNSRDSVSRIESEMASNINTKFMNQKEIVFYQNDVIFFERSHTRREKRNQFTQDLCQKQVALLDVHSQRYHDTLSRVNQLKDEISSQ